MPDSQDRSDRQELKNLLRAAESRIEQLMEQNRALDRFCSDLMAGQRAETEQMVVLTEQLWGLEQALSSKDAETADILGLLAAMKERMTGMRDQALQAMKAAADNSSRLQIVRHVFDIAVMSEQDELDQRLARYNARIAGPGR